MVILGDILLESGNSEASHGGSIVLKTGKSRTKSSGKIHLETAWSDDGGVSGDVDIFTGVSRWGPSGHINIGSGKLNSLG